MTAAHAAMLTDDSTVLQHCNWTPISYRRVSPLRLQSMVELTHSDDPHIRKKDKHAVRNRTQTITVAKYLQRCPALPILAIMFKAGRCGSTLLTNLLQHETSIKLVEEPSVLSINLRGQPGMLHASSSNETTRVSAASTITISICDSYRCRY